jgi:hypothetical protein
VSRDDARRRLVTAATLALLACLGGGAGADGSGNDPSYDTSGALRLPSGYREWVFVGASLGLSYAEGGPPDGPGSFHHTYLRPESYEEFRRTGRFPDKTVLVLELYQAAQKAAPSRHGLFQGQRLAVEAAVKDAARFSEGWAYFSFADGSPTARPFPRPACFNCHREHAATDNVFVQFYPVLRDGGH